MNNNPILVVDDDPSIRRIICRILNSEGMTTLEAGGGAAAVQMAESQTFSLILLDLVMDDMDGFQVIHHLRAHGVLTPLFVISGRQAEIDKVLALGIGADDYITKPFSTMVLCAKVKACMRRISLTAPAFNNELIAGPFRYICDEMRLFKNEEEIVLSGKECLMMKYFLSNQNKILNKDQIYSGVWNSTIVDDNTVMVHIRRLRIKIEDDPNQPVYLKNIRGSGYQFVVDE
ncbi:MAG: response regulator transcription factor [Clostridium sp.]